MSNYKYTNKEQQVHIDERSNDEILRASEAIDAAGFDVWENNFVTGDTHGTNRKLFLSLGYQEDELPSTLQETFDHIHPDDLKEAIAKAEAHFRGETPRYQAEMRIQAKNGSWVWVGSYGQVLERDAKGGITRFVGMSFNIDQRRIMEETMKSMAYTDSLTNAGNRRCLFSSGIIEVERAHSYKDPLCVLIIDIDHFKAINDTHGHIVGDEVLKRIAECLSQCVSPTDYVIRYGGDEFVVLLTRTPNEKAYEIATKILRKSLTLSIQDCQEVTVSVGIAQLNENETLEDILKRGDKALYTAKHHGRNQIHFSH